MIKIKTKILIILTLFISLINYAQERPYIDKDGTWHLPEITINFTPQPKEHNGNENNYFTSHNASDRSRNVQYSSEINYTNGVYYIGQIMNDKPHGKGTLRYSDGSVYEGEFVGGIRSGNGKIRFLNKDGNVVSYDGSWSNDMWHGEGTYEDAKFIISGNVFKNGRITGENAIIKEKGQTMFIESGIKDGKLHGISTIYNSGGSEAGKYEYKNGENTGMVFSEKSRNYLIEIKSIKDISDFGSQILAAFAAFTAFSIYDENALVFVNNAKEVTTGASEGQDFFNMIAIGIKDLKTFQFQQIEKHVNLAYLSAQNSNNKAEQYFWKHFKTILKTKSGGNNPGFLRN